MKCSPSPTPITSGLPQAGGDDHVGPIAEHDAEAVRAAKLREGRLHGADERCVRVEPASAGHSIAAGSGVEFCGDQVGDDFGIGRRFEVVPVFGQLLLELAKVFDDAVVDDAPRSPSPPTCGWALRSVAGPCVAQRVWPMPMLPGRGRLLQLGGQLVDAAGRFGDGSVAVVDRDDAAAIVAAIFEPAQTFDEEIDRLVRPDVADDAAHSSDLLSTWEGGLARNYSTGGGPPFPTPRGGIASGLPAAAGCRAANSIYA